MSRKPMGGKKKRFQHENPIVRRVSGRRESILHSEGVDKQKAEDVEIVGHHLRHVLSNMWMRNVCIEKRPPDHKRRRREKRGAQHLWVDEI